MENIHTYISHPEKLNRDTLYELRLIVGKYPYFDVARLLMLKNLYLLHDIDFGKEMRKAAIHLKSRWPIFELMAGYGTASAVDDAPGDIPIDRTMALIDAFLETIPSDHLSLEAEADLAAKVQNYEDRMEMISLNPFDIYKAFFEMEEKLKNKEKEEFEARLAAARG